jgi:hypothetical protein
MDSGSLFARPEDVEGFFLQRYLSRASALAAILALALIPAVAQSPRVADLATHRIEIHAQAIESFDPRDPKKTRFGALTFRGGLVLESAYKDFGGLSGLRVSADGAHLLAVTDKGNWLRARIVYRGKTPIAIADADMAPILGPDGRPLKRRGWYDTEALALDNGIAYVGIERVNQIVRFDIGKDGLGARGQPLAVPGGMKLLPHNQSIECVEVAPNNGPLAGSLVSISEQGLDTGGNLMSFLIGSTPGVFSLKRTDEFDVSDCAATPDGRLLVLERRFSWIRGLAMRIRSVPFAAIKPGALVDGPELIVADTGFQIDNMEGLSVHRDASGALVLTIISDDNFSPLQRTVLLQFALAE